MKRRRAIGIACVLGVVVITTGCQSRAGQAALMGNERISDNDLQKIVQEQLADPAVRSVVQQKYGDDQGAYRQLILNYTLRHRLIERASQQFNVSVPDTAVIARMSALATEAGNAQQLNNALTTALLVKPDFAQRLVRDELLQTEIGYASSRIPRPSDDELRAQYESSIARYTTYKVGVIDVQDEKAGKAVIAELHKNPQNYSAIAAKHLSLGTLPAIAALDAIQIPEDLHAKLDRAHPNEAFLYTLPANTSTPGAHRVVLLSAKDVIPFDQVKPTLQENTATAAQKAAVPELNKLASQLDIKINPRYGKWDKSNGGIVDAPNVVEVPRHDEQVEPLS